MLFGSYSLLKQRARQLGLTLSQLSQLEVIDIPINHNVLVGNPNIESAPYVLHALNSATDACLKGDCHGLVTGPINKNLLNLAGISFSGHTEYLAHRTQSKNVVMSFFSSQLILGLYSTHLPLKEVPAALNQKNLITKLLLFYQSLEQFLGRQPKIAVLGLNPHAGEGGFLGLEEIEVISPALKSLAHQGYLFEGPLSADSAFSPNNRKCFDALFAMYHDQGLCGLKAIDFGTSVNVTIGLPFVRTSVDHGTAYPLAGTGRADSTSFFNAIELATQLIS